MASRSWLDATPRVRQQINNNEKARPVLYNIRISIHATAYFGFPLQLDVYPAITPAASIFAYIGKRLARGDVSMDLIRDGRSTGTLIRSERACKFFLFNRQILIVLISARLLKDPLILRQE